MRTMRRVAWLLGMAALVLLILLPVSACAADNYPIEDNGKWAGSVNNVKGIFDADPDFDLDFSSGDKLWGIIPIPDLKMSLTLELGTEGEFEIELKQPNLPDGIDFNHQINKNTAGIYKVKISNSIFEYLPSYYGFGFDMDSYLIAGATKPVKVKGTFHVTAKVTLDLDGLHPDYHPTVEFTSIEPLTADETFVCVGVHFDEKINIGEIGWRSYTIGPLAKGNIGFMAESKAKATLHKDEWDGDANYIENDRSIIHSCTENGRAGCVDGITETGSDIYADFTVDLTLPIIDYNVYRANFELKHFPQTYGRRPFVQSLTWREKIRYQQYCDHLYYQVPVAVWANRNKTIPVAGIYVHHDGYVDIDSNMTRYAYGKTGTNPTIPQPDREGKVNLYLPYKAGKYTIVVDRYNSDPQYRDAAGSGTMPTNMRRGRNDRVDIILESSEKITHSVRKEWDIDLENNDRPESVDVLLQAQYYSTGYFSWEGVQKATLSVANNWSYTFDEVPRYEMNAKGEMVEIKYRVRELKAAYGDAASGADAGIEMAEEMLEDVIADIDVVQNADGLYHPDGGALAAESKRVVPSRWDLDNTHVWETVKKKTTDWNELWQISPSMSYLKGLGTSALFPKPSVEYKVPEYTTLTGDRVEEHKTKYVVEYEEDGNTTTIKNTAVLDFAIYKRWIMLGDAEAPDHVYICLNYRLDENYRQYAGGLEQYVGMWIPVISPVSGNMVNLLELAGMDTLAKLDVLNKVSIPIAIGKAKAPKNLENPLTAWRVKFTVKKYGWLGIPGLPVEFQAQELSSTIVTDVLKFLTGVDIPVSFSINPFSGDKYVTVPGFPLNIPGLDKEWEYTCNVINTWADFDGDDDVTAIGGTKTWVGDREEDRPETLTIVVKDGETEVGRITMNKSDFAGQDSWVWALKSNEVNSGVTLDSSKIYTVTEEFPEGYQYKDNYACAVKGHDLVNTWVNRPAKVVLKKVFVSAEKALRPSGVKVDLQDGDGRRINEYEIQTGGEAEVYTVILDKDPEGNSWDIEALNGYTLANETYLDHDKAYEDYFETTYSGPELTTETDEQDGVTPVYTFTVTNEYTGSFWVSIRKIWQDDDPEDRPDSVSFTLSWGEKVEQESVSRSENWAKTLYWQALGEVGLELTEAVVPGYRSEVVRSVDGNRIGFLVTNTLENHGQTEETVAVKGTKTWDDQDNAAGTRPDSINIRVLTGAGPAMVNGCIAEKTVTAADGWAWEFAGLPRFDDDGNEIRYQVMESVTETGGGETKQVPVPGYTVSYADPVYDEENAAWTCDITNSTDKINVSVQKVWEDNDNSMGIRPETVTVHLTAKTEENGEEVGTAEISAETGWAQVFSQLPEKDENDREITYSVTEDPVEGYETEVTSGSAADGAPAFTVTNTEDGTRMNIKVTKVWQGDAAHADDRPDTVTVHLFRNGEETDSMNISGRNGWTGCFQGVLKADEYGNAYTYTLTEDQISGYAEGVVTGSAETGFTVINEFNNKMTVTIIKEWDILDGSDESADRVPFVLLRNGENFTPYTLLQFVKKDEGWKKVYQDLDKYDGNGDLYYYNVAETASLGPFKPYYDRIEQDDGLTLKMINRQTGRNITVYKVWDDEDNAGNTRPETITVHLMRNGAEASQRQMNKGQKDTYFLDMPVYVDDNADPLVPYEYSVTETPVDGYITAVTGNMSDGFTITNTLIRDSKSITVTKNWVDEDNAYNNRPDTVTVRLLADGTEVSRKAFGAGADGTWSCTFTGLQVYTTGTDGTKRAIVYTITEDPVPGYDSEIKGFSITNTLKRVDITAKKIWEDNEDAEGMRPEYVDAMLYINGEYSFRYSGVMKPDMKPEKNWNYKQGDMPAWKDGAEILYEVKEDTVPGYTGTITGSVEDGFVITNTLIPSKTDITVTKEWIDGAEDDASCTIILLSDKRIEGTMREVARHTMTNTGSEKDWTWVFTDMPVYTGADNRIIRYSVQEEPLEGYGDPYYVENEAYRFTVQNWKKQYMSVNVKKVWEKDTVGERPASVTVHLLANGTETVSAELTAAKSWETTFEQMELLDENGVIKYTVTEDAVEGYESTVAEGKSEDQVIRYVVTNVKLPPPPTPEPTPEEEVTNPPTDGPTPEVTPEEEVTNPPTDGPTPEPTPEEEVTNPPTDGPTPEPTPEEEVTNPPTDGPTPEVTPEETTPTPTPIPEEPTPTPTPIPEEPTPTPTPTPEEETPTPTPIPEEPTTTPIPIPEKPTEKPTDEPPLYTITYNLNKGTIKGSSSPVVFQYPYGEVITILEAPVRDGYLFSYWKGSEYHPGDKYKVTGDHTFTAQWNYEDPYPYAFTFTKKWEGSVGDSIDWTLYNPDGSQAHKKFNKQVLNETEWFYEAWFPSEKDYYLIEKVPAGYLVRYENVGKHAAETDRCYNGGTIINYRMPKTSDNGNLWFWGAMVVVGLGIAGGALAYGKKKNRH